MVVQNRQMQACGKKRVRTYLLDAHHQTIYFVKGLLFVQQSSLRNALGEPPHEPWIWWKQKR